MKRALTVLVGAAVAVVPAVVGLQGNSSLTGHTAFPPPARAAVVQAPTTVSASASAPTTPAPSPSKPAAQAPAAHGVVHRPAAAGTIVVETGHREQQPTKAEDDHRGSSAHAEPKDDRRGRPAKAEPKDDHRGRSTHAEPEDDHGSDHGSGHGGGHGGGGKDDR